jgi:signal transduction histidine kinase
MRSVYTKIVGWCFGALLLSLVAIISVSLAVSSRAFRGQAMMQRSLLFRLDGAVRAYELGGPAQLASTLQQFSKYFPDEQHLTDVKGRDLVSGKDLSALLRTSRDGRPQPFGKHMVMVVSDGRRPYRLLELLDPPPFNIVSILPYYIPILVVLAGLCLLLASNLALPLKKLAVAVDRFGAGDLDARADLHRSDEIGELAGAFNRMAERITTLLTAERRLLLDISHELRSPLARLSFAAELTRTAKDRDAAATRLRKEIDRLTGLVNGLIQATQAEAECSSLPLAAVPVEDLVGEIVDDCRLEASAKDCEIILVSQFSESLPMDPELMRRAIENVLRNAIRFSPERARVEIRMEQQEKGDLLIRIRDYGPGVPADMMERIFLPFFRGDPSRNTSGGVGLGLAIAQRAIRLHGGEIRARNADPGLEVTISIPCVNAARAQDTSTITRSAPLPIG